MNENWILLLFLQFYNRVASCVSLGVLFIQLILKCILLAKSFFDKFVALIYETLSQYLSNSVRFCLHCGTRVHLLYPFILINFYSSIYLTAHFLMVTAFSLSLMVLILDVCPRSLHQIFVVTREINLPILTQE